MAIDLDTRVEQGTSYESNGTPEFSAWEVTKRVLEPIASLRLTVALFAVSIVLVLAGTFAQVDKDIWEVIGLYFRCWFAKIEFAIFFPPSFVPELPGPSETVSSFGLFCIHTIRALKDVAVAAGGMWFPGGKLVGLLLAANLLSAHLVRFQSAASGRRLTLGWAAIAAGVGLTWFIIAAAGNTQLFQTEPWVPYPVLWRGYQGFLGLLCLGSLYGTIVLMQRATDNRLRASFLTSLLGVTTVGLAVLIVWLLMSGWRPSDPSMRILWQLTQGSVAAAGLMAGCWAVFGRRAGIVLLHGGIGLLMFYELQVAMTAVETQMNLAEGETTSYVHDIRTYELAIIEPIGSDEERVTVVPRELLLTKKPIDVAALPFRIEIVDVLPNSHLRAASSKDKNPADRGLGVEWYAEPKAAGTGTDTDSKVDMAAAYVRLVSRNGEIPLGTYLVGMLLSMSDEMDMVTVDGKSFQLALRPKRYYKPYRFSLEDVRKEDYIGTTTPRHYASTVTIVDPTRDVNEKKTIWMNNPLRFANETFYQSGYFQERGTGVEHTTLSVVANTGWMMPYVACMLVSVGMLAHFLILLVRFLMRGETAPMSEGARQLAARLGMQTPVLPTPDTKPVSEGWGSFTAAAILFVVVGSYVLYKAIPPTPKPERYDLYAAGQIPVVQEGRAKPLDSAAYAALLAISNRTFVEIGHGKDAVRLTPTQWLLDVIAETKAADHYDVIRIENLEVQETVGVKKREGMRYSRHEIQQEEQKLREQVILARKAAEKDRKSLSVYQRKILELDEKLSTYDNLKFAFGLQHRIGGDTQEEVIRSFQAAMRFERMLAEQGNAVRAIGPASKDDEWQTFAGAWLKNVIESVRDKKAANPSVTAWDTILTKYAAARQADAELESPTGETGENTKSADADAAKVKAAAEKRQEFNAAVSGYLAQLDRDPPYKLELGKTQFEAYFNAFQPFTLATRLYIVAFVLGALGWLGYTQLFNRMAFSLLLVTLLLHTFALAGRIYISGRPPVTNLYSSAVFIGWGCVVLGLLLEKVFKLGVGNLIASVAGYATLLIADGLALKGDTFTVLQAVLDTQFWLATHVTTITLGYATTYLAGLLGIVYVLRGVFTPSLTPAISKDLSRMIYGTLCFSIFFSFVGTVLGGLWADDSWGRFWGWDPKENGALIIVLWNALVLHARWGGMVKERGMAVLAIAGNIFVSWSWWGVNELGAGLHSYGFTEGTVIKLGLFVASQLVLVGIGLWPRRMWFSKPTMA